MRSQTFLATAVLAELAAAMAEGTYPTPYPTGDAAQCCKALSQSPGLEGKVYQPETPAYEDRLTTSYWSKSAALEPWCMVMPESAHDASQIMKALTANNCPFGIKGGGHGTFAGSNGVKKGVTIDFGYMNATTYHANKGLASVGPGGHWGDVYQDLAPYGVAVTGGRASTVGVGGFISGGGNSFHAGRYGFACDTVENFEVVLANGTIVNANQNENRDLWTVLRGGSGNFGLITRFDMTAIPYAQPNSTDIFGGVVTYDVGVQDQVVDEYVKFADNIARDPDTSSLIWWAYTPETGMTMVGCFDNSANVANPPALDGLLSIENGIQSNSLRHGSLFNITDELSGGDHEYNIWYTGAYANDARVISYAGEKHEKLVHKVEAAISPGGYLSTLCQFQPLTATSVDHGRGNNVMGLERHVAGGDAAGNMFLMYLAVGTAEDEAVALPMVADYMADLDDYATSLGLNWDWQYLNYAFREQDPMATTGEGNIEKMRAASEKYDPEGVFQNLRSSGFKIPPTTTTTD